MKTKMNVLELTIAQLENRKKDPYISNTIEQTLDFAISTIKNVMPAYHAEIELAKLQGKNEQLREMIAYNNSKTNDNV